MKKENQQEIVLCSDCFRDEGLKLDALNLGIDNGIICPNCKSVTGKKLTRDLVFKLSHIFFVKGTLTKCKYGGSPRIVFNIHQYGNSEIKFPNWLVNDVKLLEEAAKIGFFFYGPRFWMIGEIEPLKSLQVKKERAAIINRIVSEYPTKEIHTNEFLYRLRREPLSPCKNKEYDAPPLSLLGKGRFDSKRLPVLYASQDLELCIHESMSFS